MAGNGTDSRDEIERGERFAFGENWRGFLASVDEKKIESAEESLRGMLEVDLAGKSFLDAGCGSGLFSLAARRLGARVRSFDFDAESVACAAELRRRFRPDDSDWVVEPGSVLDETYLRSLGTFDVVYSWGVLHHTGRMWDALGYAGDRVAPGGRLFISIYNDQGWPSRWWLATKKAYNRLPPALRFMVLAPATLRLWGPSMVKDVVRGRPFATWRGYATRGMSPWTDVIDWVGGFPFEVAKPEQVFDFYKLRGFTLTRMRTCAGGIGCNEFVFERSSA